MKKIALFIPSLDGGGAERVFVNLANGFIAKGFFVDLVLVKEKGDYLSLLDNKINIINLNSKKTLYSLFKLVRYLKKYKPDILLSTMHYVNVVAVMAKKIANVKTKVFIREANYFSEALKNNTLIKKVYIYLMCFIFYRYSDKIICISQSIKKDLIKSLYLKENKMIVIYNPYNPVIKNMVNSDLNDAIFFDKKKVIISIGRLTKQKDHRTLIHAFKLVNKNISAKLIILGDGPEKSNLVKLINKLNLSKDVFLLGFKENPYYYIYNSDLFVLSSIYEGLPNVLIESLVCGTNILSTDCPGGSREILDNGNYGKLVPVGDVNYLASEMGDALINPIDKKILENRAEYFSSDKIINKYIGLFNL